MQRAEVQRSLAPEDSGTSTLRVIADPHCRPTGKGAKERRVAFQPRLLKESGVPTGFSIADVRLFHGKRPDKDYADTSIRKAIQVRKRWKPHQGRMSTLTYCETDLRRTGLLEAGVRDVLRTNQPVARSPEFYNRQWIILHCRPRSTQITHRIRWTGYRSGQLADLEPSPETRAPAGTTKLKPPSNPSSLVAGKIAKRRMSATVQSVLAKNCSVICRHLT